MNAILRTLSAATIALAAGAAMALPAAGATTTVAVPTASPAGYAYTWYWSDGYSGSRRTFSQYQYGTAANLPTLGVDASCANGARVGDKVKLQFRNSYGRYVTEDVHLVTNCNGSASFEFYPYTSSGGWARGTYKYRLIIPGGIGYKYFEITFTKR